MEANVRAFLVAEFSRIGQEQETVRRKGEEREPRTAGRMGGPCRDRRRAFGEDRAGTLPSLAGDAPAPRHGDRSRVEGNDDHRRGGRRKAPDFAERVRQGAKEAPCRAGKGGRRVGRGASTRARAAALANGYQPAVVKVVSYAHGAVRASATANYVDREDAVLETHEGIELKGREAINAEIAAWATDFEAAH